MLVTECTEVGGMLDTGCCVCGNTGLVIRPGNIFCITTTSIRHKCLERRHNYLTLIFRAVRHAYGGLTRTRIDCCDGIICGCVVEVAALTGPMYVG